MKNENRKQYKDSGQEKQLTISGHVFDESNESLPGVSVYLKDRAGVGTSTDINGAFKLSAQKGDMIIYPSEYFTAHKGVTSNTRCIHHFGASWLPLDRRVKDKIIKYKNRIIRRIKRKCKNGKKGK